MRDICKAVMWGLCAAAGLSAILLLCGIIFGKNLTAGLETAKSGMLVVTALGLLFIAGIIMKRGKKQEEPAAENWSKQFHRLGYNPVIAIVVAIFLCFSVAFDLILWR